MASVSLGDISTHTQKLTSGDLASDVLVYSCWFPACEVGLPESPTGVTDGLQVFIGPLCWLTTNVISVCVSVIDHTIQINTFPDKAPSSFPRK